MPYSGIDKHEREGENSFLAAGSMLYSLIGESASPLRSLTFNVHPVKHAWLTHLGSDADRETAIFPSCLLLPSMACVLRQHELVTGFVIGKLPFVTPP